MTKKTIYGLELLEPERFILFLTICIVAMNMLQILWRGVGFDWQAYAGLAAIALACIAGGHFYRVSGRSARIGAALMGTGVFSLFSQHAVVFNYLLMPTNQPPIDAPLMAIDAAIGYHWPDIIAWMAENPAINDIIRIAYMSTIPQLAFVVIILGMTGRIRQLHTFLVSITIISVIGVVFWALFPTHGAKAYHEVPAAIELLANPIVTTEYGRDLIRLAAEGPGFITPAEIKGLIAFPSFHIVLACNAVWFMRGVKWGFPFYLVLNALIFPGTPMHGGHHLVDIPAGVAFFALGAWLAARVVGSMYRKEGLPDLLPKEDGAKPEGKEAAA